jgi:hypothetical protein
MARQSMLFAKSSTYQRVTKLIASNQYRYKKKISYGVAQCISDEDILPLSKHIN